MTRIKKLKISILDLDLIQTNLKQKYSFLLYIKDMITYATLTIII